MRRINCHKIKRLQATIKVVRGPEEEGLPRHSKNFKSYKSNRPRLHDRSTLHTCGSSVPSSVHAECLVQWPMTGQKVRPKSVPAS